jgi:hypothetical protein
MRRQIFISLLFFCSCTGIKHYTNSSGWARPYSNSVFRYKKYAGGDASFQVIDTNSIYIDSIGKRGDGTNHFFYRYFRFMSNGHLFSSLDTLAVPDGNNMEKGSIGYYYIDKGKLRMELFEETYGITGSMRRTFGYFQNDSLFTYQQTPETFYNSYKITSSLSKKYLTIWTKYKLSDVKPVNTNW